MLLETNYEKPEDIDLEFDLINHMWDRVPYYEFLTHQSERCRQAHDCLLDIRIGPRDQERVDVYRARRPGAPIVVFVHGGWWRGGTRKEFGISANGLAARGYTVVMSDYTLCPEATIPDISHATRAAVVWAYEHAEEIHGDDERIFVVGHSAGGQQAAMMAVTDWTRYGVPADVVKGCVPISGIFDLYPFRACWLQAWLQLTDVSVRSESALFNVPRAPAPPVLVMLGEEESNGFHAQATAFVDAWRASGHRAKYLDVAGEDHSTCLYQLGHADSVAVSAMVAFFESC